MNMRMNNNDADQEVSEEKVKRHNVKEDYTSYISGGIAKRRNILVEWFVRFLFRKIAFDTTSLEILKKHEGNGKFVFAVSQSRSISMLIFSNLLRKNNMPVPSLTLGFRTSFVYICTIFLKKVFHKILSILGIRKYRKVSDAEYLARILDEDKTVAISILSRALLLRRYVEKKTDFIYDLVDLQKSIDTPILIFHEMIFWNLNPEKNEPNISPKATGDRGIISGFFATKRSVTPAFIHIAEPINLKEEIAASNIEETAYISASVREKLHDIYNNEKRIILGPVVKTRYEVMEKVLLNKNVIDEISRQAAAKKTSEKKLRKKAFGYFNEIAADFSINYISAANRVLDFAFKKIFKGIKFNLDDFMNLRESMGKGTLVIVPSHKSHVDYLIISCLFYRNKVMAPHVVAGVNMNFFLIGHILRRAGAFYMRRSFRGLELYSVIFKQYIKTLVSEGYPIEFFIEGGRTRTGKLLFPKLGILKYLIESIDEGYGKDLLFVPATINYDRVLEENSYSSELKGKEKKKESTVSFVKSSRSHLKRNYGEVRLNINQPISLSELRKKLKVNKNESDTEEIAMFLAKRINEITMVTPFSLVTTAILFSSSRGFSREVLEERVKRVYDYLQFQNVSMADICKENNGINKSIDLVLESYQNDSIIGLVKLTGVKDSSKKALEDIYLLNDEERIRISFYRNTIIHYLVPISFVSLAILNSRDKNGTAKEKVEKGYDAITEIFSKEFIYPDMMYKEGRTIKDILSYLKNRGLIAIKNDMVSVTEKGAEELVFYAAFMCDYLESYMIVFEEVLKQKDVFGRKDLLESIRANGVRMYHLDLIKFRESLSISNYNNAIDFLKKKKYITDDKGTTDSKNPKLNLSKKRDIENCLKKVEGYLEVVR